MVPQLLQARANRRFERLRRLPRSIGDLPHDLSDPLATVAEIPDGGRHQIEQVHPTESWVVNQQLVTQLSLDEPGATEGAFSFLHAL